MPSKTVSFSDETYVDVVKTLPEDVNISSWIDYLTAKGLENVDLDDEQLAEQLQ